MEESNKTKNENVEMREHEEQLTSSALDQCKSSLAELQERYARLNADLQNYERRIIKERAEWTRNAKVGVLTELLSVLDNFDRAMASIDSDSSDARSWLQGIAMIHDTLKALVGNHGVVEMSYEAFDPEYHEALLQVESEDHEPGQIVQVLEKGYLLDDRVIRPAKVSVSK